MLIKLYVQNYALIRELDISLDQGLTVITGETGAGKSILLGALSLVLGTRADTGVLLDKTVKCVVEGTFRIKEYDLKEFFTRNELDYDHVTLIRREINPAGKSRAFINDTPVNLNILKELGEKLIDIHSQHQTLMLNENSFQMNVIDSFAGTGKLLNDYRLTFSSYRNLKREYDELIQLSDKSKADLEYYRFQLTQIEEAKLQVGEQEELERDIELLEHTGEIKTALSSASIILAAEDSSVLNMMREIKTGLNKIRDYLPEAETLLSRIDSAYIELDDIASEISLLSSRVEADPDRLNIVSARLDLIYSLIQKHRVQSLGELILRQKELSKLVGSIITGDERMNELATLIDKDLKVLTLLANNISEKRSKVVPDVEEKITSIVNEITMKRKSLRVDIVPDIYIPCSSISPDSQIVTLIKEIIAEYAKNPNAILLAIIPSGELEVSIALGFAKMYDSEFKRTLAVFTKLDQMDDQYDVRKIVASSNIKLELGFIGCRARIRNKQGREFKTIEERNHDEEKYFTRHLKYQSDWGKLFGKDVLRKKLEELFLQKIMILYLCTLTT